MERFKLFLKTNLRLIIFVIILLVATTASVIGIMSKKPEKKSDDGRPRTITVLNDDGETKRMPNFINSDDSTETEKETGAEATLPPEETPPNNEDEQSETTYVLNKSKHKFHLPTCSSVSQMAEHNKEDYTGTRDELIEAGYEPCKVCNP